MNNLETGIPFGKGAAAIINFLPTSSRYDALEILKQHLESNDLLIKHHPVKLSNLQVISFSCDFCGLRQLHDDLQSHIMLWNVICNVTAAYGFVLATGGAPASLQPDHPL